MRLSAIGHYLAVTRQIGSQQDLWRGCGSACIAVFAVFAIGTDGLTVGTGHQFAVQRPVPVSVFSLRQADYGRASVLAVASVSAVFAVLTRLALRTLFALFALVSLVTLVALRSVADGDGVGVVELDDVAHLLAVLRQGRDGGDVVRCVQQLLQGGDVAVHFVLPRFERLDALGVVVYGIPQRRVIVVVAACGECQRKHRSRYVMFHFHKAIDLDIIVSC